MSGLRLIDGVFPAKSTVPNHYHEHGVSCVALRGICEESYAVAFIQSICLVSFGVSIAVQSENTFDTFASRKRVVICGCQTSRSPQPLPALVFQTKATFPELLDAILG